MKLLAKSHKGELVAVAYNVSDSEMAILGKLIAQESLTALSMQVDLQTGGIQSFYDLATVTLSQSPMAVLMPARLLTRGPEPELDAILVQANALRYLSKCVNQFRAKSDKKIVDQSVVYAEKVSQAKRVVEGETANVGYVELEAKTKNLSISDAAVAILDAAEAHDAMLFRTEKVRISFAQKAYSLSTHADLAGFKSEVADALRLIPT